jgi:outer membrane protein assembly factor BamB
MGYFLQSGILKAINASNTVIWSFQGDGELVTAPIVINQYVMIGSSGGNIYALDASNGAVAWQKKLGAPLPSGPTYAQSTPLSGLAAGDGILVVPAGDTLTAYTVSPALGSTIKHVGNNRTVARPRAVH